MSNSANLLLPYLAASQAQKHVTLNDALILLDGLLHLSVLSRVLATPPGAPLEGDRYLVAAAATGDWLGSTGKIAQRADGVWLFHTPKSGWRLWIVDEAKFLIYNGTSWVELPLPTVFQNIALLGVNATADATNKLVVSSTSTLLNNAGNGHQLKINKNAAADTASVLYQTSFSGRAEFGLTGDDNFHLKVSPDGSTWTEALVVNATTGLVTLTNGSIGNTALTAMPAQTLKANLNLVSGIVQDATLATVWSAFNGHGHIQARSLVMI
jgi:Protein of unknown function (DUF2793)